MSVVRFFIHTEEPSIEFLMYYPVTVCCMFVLGQSGAFHTCDDNPQKKQLTTIRVYLKIGHPKTFMLYSSSLKFEFGFSRPFWDKRDSWVFGSMPAGWIQACCKHIGHTVFVTWVMKKGNRVEWKQLGTVHLLKGPQRNVNKPKSRTTTIINS